MAGAREVVTLQLGPYAGSVGAHWWGLQEASFCFDPAAARSDAGLCHDVLFRMGKTLQGQETYTPRLILVDLKGSLSNLKQELFLYQDAKTNTPLTWKGNLTTHREDPCPESPFLQDLKGNQSSNGDFAPRTLPGDASLHPKQQSEQTPLSQSVAPTWSDFLRTPLHPRSIVTIHQYNHEGESSRLEAFGQGERLLQEATYLEELEDKLHFYVEECDYLQGFQVLCDLHNGFSGVGAKVSELLQDEYAGKGILTWGLTPVLDAAMPERNLYRFLNTVLGVVHLSSHSSLFCPLSLNRSLGLRPEAPVPLPYLQYNAALDYHTSAVLATALDTLSVPYRLQGSALSMAHLAEALNFSGRKVATAAAAIPFPMGQGQSLPDALCSQQPGAPWAPVSACGDLGEGHCFAQSVVLRGIGKEYQVSNSPPGIEPKSVLHMGETGQEVLARYLYTLFPRTFSTSLLLRDPCKLFAPYPQYFSPLVSKRGFLREKPAASPEAVRSMPVLAALQSPASLRRTLSGFCEELGRQDLRRWASFFSAGVEMEDFEAALEELRNLSHCYKESSDSAADSEDELD